MYATWCTNETLMSHDAQMRHVYHMMHKRNFMSHDAQMRHVCHMMHKRNIYVTWCTNETCMPDEAQTQHLCHMMHKWNTYVTWCTNETYMPYDAPMQHLCHMISKWDIYATWCTNETIMSHNKHDMWWIYMRLGSTSLDSVLVYRLVGPATFTLFWFNVGPESTLNQHKVNVSYVELPVRQSGLWWSWGWSQWGLSHLPSWQPQVSDDHINPQSPCECPWKGSCQIYNHL